MFVVSGCGLLALSIVLIAGAVILFIMSRRKKQAVAAQAASTLRVQPVTAPAPPPPPPRMPEVVETIDPSFDPNATMVVNVNPGGSLECISGPLAGRTYAISERGFSIGRDWSQSQIVIEDPRMSKRHVWVGLREGRVVAIDEGSTNGTFLNQLGARIGEVILRPGDTLILPEDLARFTYRT
jgi:pSer/pThr/pTyr-binding forkhead associated (FHA) protein